jgi:hypothetical protein
VATFGYYDRAVSVYTHVSDQFSVFCTRVISCAPREALYVLDGLLENDSVLRLREPRKPPVHRRSWQFHRMVALTGSQDGREAGRPFVPQ